MIKKVLSYSLASLLALTVASRGAVAQDAHSAQFPGFRSGQSGFGGILGYPFGARYQKWTSWKEAMFFDMGYQTDGFFMFGGNYSFYLLSEDDRWRMDRRVGTILYNLFGGGTGGIYIGSKRTEKQRLGIRAGGAFEYLFPASDWAVRVEVAPVLFLTGTEAAGLQGGIIFMKYFGGKPAPPPPTKTRTTKPAKTSTDPKGDEWNF